MTKVLYRFLLCFMLAFTTQMAFAQGDLGDALKGSLKDANYLANGYATPMLKVMGTGINAGWNNTAKAHKTLGLDLTITVSPVFIPGSDKFYEVDNSKLENIQLSQTHTGQAVAINTGKASVPTIFGPEEKPRYIFANNVNGVKVPDPTRNSFQGPPGIDLKKNIGMNALPVPMYHLGIGIYKNTDIKFRFFPQQQFGDSKVSLFGVGVLHDVKQWIPGIKNLPFDLSAFVGYTKLKYEIALDQPGQVGQFDVTGTTIQGLISKKFSVITFYGGIGYNIAKTNLALKGNYDLDENGSYETKDPLALSATANGMRATAGMRLKLAVFTFHGDYTIQKYKTLSVGFGIAIR
ncbi:MAG: hypothetical protein DI538_08545 [Azospira oryzae]|nr:MAG: hypothetical protein DI538_08545 [Azospira oryzae]